MMQGEMFIAGEARHGTGAPVRAVNPATGETLEPAFGGATAADLDAACAAAEAAFDTYRNLPADARAAFLEAIALNILDLGDILIERAMTETGLPRPRLEGERGRTVGQLRMFAQVVRDGRYQDLRVDPADPARVPPRVDLRLRNIPLGPVAVFGSSNFPLAFSVAGGDTASALAAGAPVVAKAHPAHPGTSELVGSAVTKAVKDAGLPAGVFSLLFDAGYEIGVDLVADPRIKAVGFTGSRRGGLALLDIAQRRPEPIPVYAEMSSINPVILMPHALDARPEAIAKAFVGSLTLGAGQFCTNPGLVLAVDSPALDRFVQAAAAELAQMQAQPMLTPGIHAAYETAVAAIADHGDVRTVAKGAAGEFHRGQAALFETTADAFSQHKELQDEIFGAASLVVRFPSLEALRDALGKLEGQLTAALHVVEADHDEAAKLIPILERKVGRILFDGFGTGVEVGHAMVHGGPFPATSDSRTTSVGSLAIARWLRPVSYQDMPDGLLPAELRRDNPLNVERALLGAAPSRQSA
ncbi:aldehyde dehydrogenase (NADP(+)) [Sphingomonas sp. ASY06-1R]|uniref:aldehyde dehydrogenase (NADP(+)) n=1 Tax=Sphingomonas sp. ASY06-1R TaxID=3445771 RepID=UPI003FA1B5D5